MNDQSHQPTHRNVCAFSNLSNKRSAFTAFVLAFATAVVCGPAFAQGASPKEAVSAGAPAALSNAASLDTGLVAPLSPNVSADAGSKVSTDPFNAPAPPRGRENGRARSPDEINQFQRFVQESTGRLLPVFGRDLFDGNQTYSADTVLPVPAEYLLGPGDEIRLQVVGAIDFALNLVIDRNGQVSVPKVGMVLLAGVAARDLETTLRTSLSKVYANFTASASVGKLRGIQVYVVGQAVRPGTLQVSSLSTLVSALFASGGPNPNGSMRNIELRRGGKAITTFDMYDFISRGDKSRDVALLSGDVIVIPPAGPRVAVNGALDQAAIYELKSTHSSVADILAIGGGVPALANTQRALLERISNNITPPRQVQELVLNDQGMRQLLMDGDVLTLLGISPAFGNAVTLKGNVADALRHRWFEGMKLLDLIPEADALITPDYYRSKNLLVQILDPSKPSKKLDASKDTGTTEVGRLGGNANQINWDYAVIERLDRVKLATELIPFNLGRLILQKDMSQNLQLQAGDVVTILNQNELRSPLDKQRRVVRVEGEVAIPGLYQVKPGETLPQLIKRIGGLTAQAYLFGTDLKRESVRIRQQESLDQLVRRLEGQVQSQQTTLSANRGAVDAANAQLQQQAQQAQAKAQLDRLKTFKSSGRMSLELDPQDTTLISLPALVLEDGDRILIPANPGYVSAFGSVNNENALIYKPGKTVADVIKSAGIAEDAEPDQSFLLRADGSVASKRDRTGLFGGGFESMQVMPGDTLVVPAQLDRESRYNFLVRSLKDWTQILFNFGLGVAAFKSL